MRYPRSLVRLLSRIIRRLLPEFSDDDLDRLHVWVEQERYRRWLEGHQHAEAITPAQGPGEPRHDD